MTQWEKMFMVLVGMGPDDGISTEQRLSAYNEAKANILSVSAKQIKASWKKGSQIVKFDPYENASELTEFFIGEIARVWMVTAP
jgi:hypothetical protein